MPVRQIDDGNILFNVGDSCIGSDPNHRIHPAVDPEFPSEGLTIRPCQLGSPLRDDRVHRVVAFALGKVHSRHQRSLHRREVARADVAQIGLWQLTFRQRVVGPVHAVDVRVSRQRHVAGDCGDLDTGIRPQSFQGTIDKRRSSRCAGTVAVLITRIQQIDFGNRHTARIEGVILIEHARKAAQHQASYEQQDHRTRNLDGHEQSACQRSLPCIHQTSGGSLQRPLGIGA